MNNMINIFRDIKVFWSSLVDIEQTVPNLDPENGVRYI